MENNKQNEKSYEKESISMLVEMLNSYYESRNRLTDSHPGGFSSKEEFLQHKAEVDKNTDVFIKNALTLLEATEALSVYVKRTLSVIGVQPEGNKE